MKRTLLVVAAALSLSACAESGYGRGPYFAGDTVYYDNAYGPFDNGYWGDDGFFYYSAGRGRGFHRDDGHHFRHDEATGFHGVHSHMGWRGFHAGGGSSGGHHDHDHDGH